MNRCRLFYPGLVVVVLMLSMAGCQLMPEKTPLPDLQNNWIQPADWSVNTDGGGSSLALSESTQFDTPVLKADFDLAGDRGFSEIIHVFEEPWDIAQRPLIIRMKAYTDCEMEIKVIDQTGTVHGRRIYLAGTEGRWVTYVLYERQIEFWWGPFDTFEDLKELRLAFVGAGQGSVIFSQVGIAVEAEPTDLLPLGPMIDPDAEMPGIGFRQRRDAKLNPVDPLVLEWLKQNQDSTLPQKNLLSSMDNPEVQTFNNALVAQAFLLKGEQERAERILDFYAQATDTNNMDRTLQNFFYNGEARGFYQAVFTVETNGTIELHSGPGSDRWMGDMVWLMYVYLYYSEHYDAERYKDVMQLLRSQIEGWFIDDPNGPGGYVQHGWIDDDSKLHESFGHVEGNIDCYALFKLLGDEERAGKIKEWLSRHLRGETLPLDLYTWRVLAFGKEEAECLNIPDYDMRYRKTLDRNGKKVSGVYHSANAAADNVWLDGIGHMACAYFAIGNFERGNFYANQMDGYIIEYEMNGKTVHAIPFVHKKDSEYQWVDLNRGFISAGAWYIFAKNRFNPMTLKTAIPPGE